MSTRAHDGGTEVSVTAAPHAGVASTDRVGGSGSSSSIVRMAQLEARPGSVETVCLAMLYTLTPRRFCAGPYTSLSTAVTVTVPVLAVSPSGITRRTLSLSVKSDASARRGVPAGNRPVCTRSCTSPNRVGWLSFAVTVATPPFSDIAVGVSTTDFVGWSSSSTTENSSNEDGVPFGAVRALLDAV